MVTVHLFVVITLKAQCMSMVYVTRHHKTVKCLRLNKLKSLKVHASAIGGAGTTGGSINMISKVAKKGDFLEGSVGAGTDNYQRIHLRWQQRFW